MTHDEIQAELSAFALGALDAPEQRALEEHLASGCDTCRQELAVWRDVVGSLALVGQEDAAPDLKPALLQRVRPATARRTKVIALPRWSLLPLAAAALVILALGLMREHALQSELDSQRQLASTLRTDAGAARQQVEQLAQQLTAKEHDLATLRAALVAAQESLAIVQKPGLQMVRMHAQASPQPGRPAEAHALISSDTHRALFYAFDLPTVPPDKAYELWWITEKQGPVRAGMFAPDERGFGRLEMPLPDDVGIIQAAAVTIEPAAGVPKPTGPMILTPVTSG